MEYNVSTDILPHVKALLTRDMETTAITGVTDFETLSLSSLIENNLPIAAVDIVRVAPLPMFSTLTKKSFKKSNIEKIAETKYNKQGGKVGVDDMCRIVGVNAYGWAKDVFDIDSASNVLHDIARDPLNGTLGTAGTPYVCMSYDNAEKLIFYPYIEMPQEEGEEERYCLDVNYVPYPSITEDKINIEPKLYEAICLYTAFLVAMEKKMSNAEGYKVEAFTNIGVNTK